MASYNILLKIKEKNISLILQKDGAAVSQDAWLDQNNLLEEFFPRLQVLLESNSLLREDISAYALETDLPTGYTMVRIAQTLMATLNFAME